MLETTPAVGTAAPLPDRAVVPPVWGRITNIMVDHGEGAWLVTVDGERYLDYSSGIGVTNTGHAHPRVVAAVQAQAAKLHHGQQNITYHEPGLRPVSRSSCCLSRTPCRACRILMPRPRPRPKLPRSSAPARAATGPALP